MIEVREATTADISLGIWRSKALIVAVGVMGLLLASIGFFFVGSRPVEYEANSSVAVVRDSSRGLEETVSNASDLVPTTAGTVVEDLKLRGVSYFVPDINAKVKVEAAVVGTNMVRFRVIAPTSKEAADAAGAVAQGVADTYRGAVIESLEVPKAALEATAARVERDLEAASGKVQESLLILELSQTRQSIAAIDSVVASTNGGISIVDLGSTAKRVNGPTVIPWALGGMIGGLVIGLFVSAIRTAFDRRIRSRADVSALAPRSLFVSVLGEGSRADWSYSLLATSLVAVCGEADSEVVVVPIDDQVNAKELTKSIGDAINALESDAPTRDGDNRIPVGRVTLRATAPLLQERGALISTVGSPLVVLVLNWGSSSFDELLFAADLLRDQRFGVAIASVPSRDVIRAGLPSESRPAGRPEA